jgi:hypothetical protein
MSDTTDETNLATEFFARLGARDVDGVLALTAPGFTWKIIGGPEQFALAGTFDRDEFLGVLARVGAAFDTPPKNEVVSVTEGRDRIWVEAHVSGRSKAGEPYENDLAYVFEIADGKITAAREYLDTIAAQELFG